MLFRTAFLHMERSEAIEDFAQKKIGAKIDRLAQRPIGGLLTFIVEKDQHIVKLNLKDKTGEEIALHAQNGDMYSAINKLADQVEKYLRRKKEKRIRGRIISKEEKSEMLIPEEILA